MRALKLVVALGAALLLSGCYITAPLYTNPGGIVGLAAKYSCSEPEKEAKIVRLKEQLMPIGGAWYMPDIPLIDKEGRERIAFHPLSFGRYIVSVDRENDGRQFVFSARIEDKRITLFVPSTSDAEQWLMRKYGIERAESGLVGHPDFRHRFFAEMAKTDDVKVIYTCEPLE